MIQKSVLSKVFWRGPQVSGKSLGSVAFQGRGLWWATVQTMVRGLQRLHLGL